MRAAPSATDDARGEDRADERGAAVLRPRPIFAGRTGSLSCRATLRAMATRPAAQPRPAVRDRPGGGQARLRLLLRARTLTDVLPWTPASSRLELAGSERGRHLREMLDELGPTFVKFGQLLSTRPDVLPPDIIAELRGLQDDVRPFPFEEARADDRGGARAPARAGLPRVRRDADRGGLDRPGAPGDAAERRPGRRSRCSGRTRRAQIEADLALLYQAARIAKERVRALDFIDARGARRRVRALDPAGARLPARGAERRPVPARLRRLRRTSTCRRSSGATRGSRVLTLGVPGRRPARRRRPLERTRSTSGAGSRTGSPRRGWTMIFRHGFFHADPHPANILVLDGPTGSASSTSARRASSPTTDMSKADAALHRRRERERRRAAAAARRSRRPLPEGASRSSSAPSCASSSTATTARASPRSTRSR